MRAMHIPKALCYWLFVSVVTPRPQLLVQGIDSPAGVILSDHSKDAINLFNNMRTPAALLTGGLVPLGILTAPVLNENDSKLTKRLKKANILLGVCSLLSEILAVTYASIAINKLVEVPSPATVGVAELIQQTQELAWLGTNIHFLLGLMGFGLLVGNRVFLAFGNPIGKLAIGFSIAFFLQTLAIVNKGINMGSTNDIGVSSHFASNFLFLCLRYLAVAVKRAFSGACGIAAVVVLAGTAVTTAIEFNKLGKTKQN